MKLKSHGALSPLTTEPQAKVPLAGFPSDSASWIPTQHPMQALIGYFSSYSDDKQFFGWLCNLVPFPLGSVV